MPCGGESTREGVEIAHRHLRGGNGVMIYRRYRLFGDSIMAILMKEAEETVPKAVRAHIDREADHFYKGRNLGTLAYRPMARSIGERQSMPALINEGGGWRALNPRMA